MAAQLLRIWLTDLGALQEIFIPDWQTRSWYCECFGKSVTSGCFDIEIVFLCHVAGLY
jgi:hypothetical protein